ncbi:GGDEF domain-containing protein [Mesorhizobium marinum]|uniref:GGDEF domain-containing protein n=1 Tax=Mesorhizobium marinum TaxID=3228790 RepID=UPI003465CEF2
MLAACLFGILTRPVGFLAALWPANAVMLGLLIRFPKAAGLFGWAAAAAAYLVADLITGSSLQKAIVLNAANLLGVAAGYLVLRRVSEEVVSLRHSTAMFHLLFASAIAGAAAGLVGALANPLLFAGGAFEGWSFWFATELVNYVTFLPLILALPKAGDGGTGPERAVESRRWPNAAPALAVFASCLVAVLGGGPGAIAYPVPALLWCGLTYSVFRTTLLTAIFGCWTLIATGAGLYPHFIEPYDEKALVSVRIAIALVSMAPIMLASIMHGRNELLAELRHRASHDTLTGAANRSAFRDAAERAFQAANASRSIMMIDIDRFKAINDSFGHAAGDEVLVSFVGRVRNCLRNGDLLARMGGEEFAILLDAPGSRAEAVAIGERILDAVGERPVTLANGRTISVTASIGLAFSDDGRAACVDSLLSEADAALYRAKQNGRNRIEFAASA